MGARKVLCLVDLKVGQKVATSEKKMGVEMGARRVYCWVETFVEKMGSLKVVTSEWKMAGSTGVRRDRYLVDRKVGQKVVMKAEKWENWQRTILTLHSKKGYDYKYKAHPSVHYKTSQSN